MKNIIAKTIGQTINKIENKIQVQFPDIKYNYVIIGLKIGVHNE